MLPFEKWIARRRRKIIPTAFTSKSRWRLGGFSKKKNIINIDHIKWNTVNAAKFLLNSIENENQIKSFCELKETFNPLESSYLVCGLIRNLFAQIKRFFFSSRMSECDISRIACVWMLRICCELLSTHKLHSFLNENHVNVSE